MKYMIGVLQKMFSKKINIICAGTLLCTVLATSQISLVKADDSELILNIATETYTGTYSGDTKDGEPSGEGTFSVSDDNNDFTLSGTWKDGLLEGNVEIDYADGAKTNAQFKNGLMTGTTTEYNADGSYSVYSCTKGRPYGRIYKYDSDGHLNGDDFYYQMRTISSLKAASIEADYNQLLGTSFPDSPQKITGTVAAVFSSSNNCFIILYDNQSHPYVLTYANNSTNKYNQAIVPNLKEGDHITAYGYLQKQDALNSFEDELGRSLLVTDAPENMYSLSDNDLSDILDAVTSSASAAYNENATSTLPFILVFAADVSGSSSFDTTAPSMDYSDIINNPYLYSNIKYTLTGTVKKCVSKYDKGYVQLIISENETNNLFYVKYRYSDGSELPATGDLVTVNGLFNGNYKKIIPDEDANILKNNSSNVPDADDASDDTTVDSANADSNIDSADSSSESIEDVVDDDILEDDVLYDKITYVILYPRLSATDITIQK